MKTQVEPLPVSTYVPVPSIIEPPKLELKPLPDTLKYAFLGDFEIFPVIISSHLDKDQEEKLLDVLNEHKEDLGWTIEDINGISEESPRNAYIKVSGKGLSFNLGGSMIDGTGTYVDTG